MWSCEVCEREELHVAAPPPPPRAAPPHAMASTSAAGKLAKLEEKLQAAYKRGNEKNDYVGGYGGGHLHAESFEAVEQHEKDRQRLAAEVKKARAAAKKEKKNIKQQAAAINEASSWTSKILEGEARFAAAEVDTEGALAQATYGLKSADDFRRTRERLEEEREEERGGAARGRAGGGGGRRGAEGAQAQEAAPRPRSSASRTRRRRPTDKINVNQTRNFALAPSGLLVLVVVVVRKHALLLIVAALPMAPALRSLTESTALARARPPGIHLEIV